MVKTSKVTKLFKSTSHTDNPTTCAVKYSCCGWCLQISLIRCFSFVQIQATIFLHHKANTLVWLRDVHHFAHSVVRPNNPFYQIMHNRVEPRTLGLLSDFNHHSSCWVDQFWCKPVVCKSCLKKCTNTTLVIPLLLLAYNCSCPLCCHSSTGRLLDSLLIDVAPPPPLDLAQSAHLLLMW